MITLSVSDVERAASTSDEIVWELFGVRYLLKIQNQARPKMFTATCFDKEKAKFVIFFRGVLRLTLLEAERAGLNSLEISPTCLTERVQCLLKVKDRVPEVCQAMRDEFARDAGDMIVEGPSINQPSQLAIRYVLPRPATRLSSVMRAPTVPLTAGNARVKTV